jgi:hypothetical protein
MSTRTDKNPSLSLNHDSTRNIDQEILRAVHDLAFGSVEVVIHDNRVTEIKQVRRTRFESRKND